MNEYTGSSAEEFLRKKMMGEAGAKPENLPGDPNEQAKAENLPNTGGEAKPAQYAGGYTAKGIYNDAQLGEQDKAKIAALTQQYNAAKAAGDTSAMDEYHRQAEAIRGRYNYSGGEDGSMYIDLPRDTSGAGAYQPAQILGPTSLDDRINRNSDTAIEAAKAALKAAYDQNMIDVDAAAEKIPGLYQDARRQTAGAAEIQRANFNEYAAAAGLNNGAAGQAQLAMGNQLQENLSGINKEEANARRDIETQRLKLKTQYQNDIAMAIQNGELERAAALTQEAQRVDQLMIAQSQAQADEDYRAWAANKAAKDDEKNRALELVTAMINKKITPPADLLQAAGVSAEYVKAMTSGGTASVPTKSPQTTDPTTSTYDKLLQEAMIANDMGIATSSQINMLEDAGLLAKMKR